MAEDLAQVFRRIKPGVVAIAVARGDEFDSQIVLGTGFNVDPRGLVLTAAHVIRPVIASPNEADRKNLLVEFVIPNPAEGVVYRADVGVSGFPLGLAFEPSSRASSASTFQTGIVGAIVPHPSVPTSKRKQYRLDIGVNYGNSGGPVFLPSDGRVIGIVTDRPAYQAAVLAKGIGPTDYTVLAQSGLTHAIPIEYAAGVVTTLRAMSETEVDDFTKRLAEAGPRGIAVNEHTLTADPREPEDNRS